MAEQLVMNSTNYDILLSSLSMRKQCFVATDKNLLGE